MANDRSAAVTIGGKNYEMILTTRATKEIAKRYGGLANLGEKLMKSENFEMALDEVVWLITLLANQSVLVHNLQNPEDKRELLTEEAVELLTSPLELATYKESIMEACSREPSARSKARMTQKTRRSGKRRGVVCPTYLLWRFSAPQVRAGGLAHAAGSPARPVGVL